MPTQSYFLDSSVSQVNNLVQAVTTAGSRYMWLGLTSVWESDWDDLLQGLLFPRSSRRTWRGHLYLTHTVEGRARGRRDNATVSALERTSPPWQWQLRHTHRQYLLQHHTPPPTPAPPTAAQQWQCFYHWLRAQNTLCYRITRFTRIRCFILVLIIFRVWCLHANWKTWFVIPSIHD